MDKLPGGDFEKKKNMLEKEEDLLDQIKQKLTEQGENLKKVSSILDELNDIGTNIGKENSRVMFDIKYKADLIELFRKDKELIQEVEELEAQLKVVK